MGLFGSTQEFMPTRPGLIVSPGRKFNKVMAAADATIAAALAPDEQVLCYAVCFEDISDQIVAVTDRQVILARKSKIFTRPYSQIRATRLLVRPNGTWMIAIDPPGPRIALLQFTDEQHAQMVCGAIDSRLAA